MRYDTDATAYEWDIDGRRHKKFMKKPVSLKHSESAASSDFENYKSKVDIEVQPPKLERRDNRDSKDDQETKKRKVVDSPQVDLIVPRGIESPKYQIVVPNNMSFGTLQTYQHQSPGLKTQDLTCK